jgi:hypothetical protein
VDVECVDVSSSVPRSFVHQYKTFLAAEIRSDARRDPSGGTVYYIRSVRSNSVASRAALLTVAVPSVGARPAPPQPDPRGNVFDPTRVEQARTAYQKRLDAWRSSQQRAWKAADAGARQLSKTRFGIDRRGTDILGCVASAQRLFTDFPRDRHHLGIATDAIPYGPQQAGRLHLHGVVADAYFWCTGTFRLCTRRQADLTETLQRAGALVRPHDAQELNSGGIPR